MTFLITRGSASDELDADIAGPGVIIGFILSNFLTLTAATTTLWLRRWPKKRLLGLQAAQWNPILNNFVRALSDQQLITGLLLMVIGLAKYYHSSVNLGHNNLWTAGDIVMFSSVTHAITLITLRPYFRIHHKLAMFRVVLMWSTYGLWLVVAAGILTPKKNPESHKLHRTLAQFWRVATWLEIFCIAYMYLITIFPIVITEEAATVREIIAKISCEPKDLSAIELWINDKRRRPSPIGLLTHHHSPYGRVRLFIKWSAKQFCRKYISIAKRASATNRKFQLEACSLLAEVLWPWYWTLALVMLLWLFGFGTMVVNLRQNDLLHYWGFGQLLPLVFLLLPLYDVVSDFSEKRTREDVSEGIKPSEGPSASLRDATSSVSCGLRV
ncbi:uncharacterized protein AB675_6843 [Cyphellophora attinorum]|uniref:Uncharacterized protein n=1 Tax=Cyphellophora attinorum TaxID=1664694 RepID=A0A0N1HDN5_9EURO|nr:uncharacterized protein AB675_6843 [Phialophora attinorum]KPI43163.1 hypothetical protein AB675_6843 [Phialophora attinorum]